MEAGEEQEQISADILYVKNHVVEMATVLAPVARLAEVARRFFYTIVTNYYTIRCGQTCGSSFREDERRGIGT